MSANGLMESDVKWIREMTSHAIYMVAQSEDGIYLNTS